MTVFTDTDGVHMSLADFGKLVGRAELAEDLAALEAQFREKAVAVADGLKRIESIVEFGLKREMESPSNHQEFAREAGEKLSKFWKDLKDAEAVLALHAEIEKRKGRGA